MLTLQFLDEYGDFGYIRKNFLYRLLERIATLFRFTQLLRELHNILISLRASLFGNMKSEQHLYAVVGENAAGRFHIVMVLVGLFCTIVVYYSLSRTLTRSLSDLKEISCKSSDSSSPTGC